VIRMKALSDIYQSSNKRQTKKYILFNIYDCRMLLYYYIIYYRLRIIGLSATLPNISDIGEWLNCTPDVITITIMRYAIRYIYIVIKSNIITRQFIILIVHFDLCHWMYIFYVCMHSTKYNYYILKLPITI
jgi:hypothetical protein